ncbi:unnamed protein product, partial [Polarella glacialis]
DERPPLPTRSVPCRPPPPEPGQRMQVLVLHGRQSNANLVNYQISGLKAALGKDVDFHFLEGDVLWTFQEGRDLHDADQLSVSLSKGQPFKDWFGHATDDLRSRPDLFRQFDPGVKVSYEGADAAVDKLLHRLQEEGPRIDIVVGVFEGSIVVHLAVARLLQNGFPVPWRLSVLFGSLPIRDDSYAAPFAGGLRKADHATIHVFGRADEYYFYGRTGAGRGAPEDYYQGALVLEHGEGHRMPSVQPAAGRLLGRVAEEMHRLCSATST